MRFALPFLKEHRRCGQISAQGNALGSDQNGASALKGLNGKI
jgi:hypothetical protein